MKKDYYMKIDIKSPFSRFATKSPDQLAMHVTKYPQREGWSHRDLFRLAHPDLKKAISRGDFEDRKLEYEQVYRYVVKG